MTGCLGKWRDGLFGLGGSQKAEGSPSQFESALFRGQNDRGELFLRAQTLVVLTKKLFWHLLNSKEEFIQAVAIDTMTMAVGGGGDTGLNSENSQDN